MCLTNASEIKTAKKNILVYKELDYFRFSPDYSYEYTKGLQKNKIEISINKYQEVHEGYHTFNNTEYIDPFMQNICIIPKGTKYVEGNYNSRIYIKNRVSENLYYVGKYTIMNFIKAELFCILNVNLRKQNDL